LNFGSDVALAPLSIWLSKAMKALLPLSHNLWSKVFARHNIHVDESWILDSSNDVADLIKRFNRSLSPHARKHHIINLLSYDFKNMYTNINLADLKTRMTELFSKFYTLREEQSGLQGELLRVSMHGDNSWVSEATPGIAMRNGTITHVNFSLELLVSWLNFLLDNQFVRFGERLFRQIHGIPMGTNCAVFLANLYLFTYELDFITFLSDSGDISTLKRLQHLGRYVDDLLALEADILRDRLYLDSPNRGIYPRDTLLLEETGSGTTNHYMDLTISRDTRLGLIIDIYDKRSEPGFRRINVIRFPHISSYNFSEVQHYHQPVC
jgi:hypothetical protein